MNVILHIGAHRCATTSFQHYLRHNGDRLQQAGIGVWGPHRTRGGLFSGLQPGAVSVRGANPAARARGRVQMACARSRGAGVQALIVSDENMLGSVRENLRLATLYSSAGERLARYVDAFDGLVTDVVLNIRSQDHYWASALAYSAGRGISAPGPKLLDRLVQSRRDWRDVVQDAACAAGRARLWVFPFEAFCGQPERQLALMTGMRPPMAEARAWRNKSPDLATLRDQFGTADAPGLNARTGRWMPFDRDQAAALREAYADDILWLTAGADGAATLMTNQTQPEAGQTGPGPDMTRGSDNEYQDRRVAQAR